MVRPLREHGAQTPAPRAQRVWAPLSAAAFFNAPRREPPRGGLTPLSQLPTPTPPSRAPPSQPQSPLFRSTPPGSPLWPTSPEPPASGPTPSPTPSPEPTAPAPQEHAPLRVSSGIAELDDMAGCPYSSGFACGESIEITGPPGSGKTALSIQLAVRCRLAHVLEQLERHARARAVSEPPSSASLELFSGTFGDPKHCASLDEWLDAEILPHCGQAVVVDTEGGAVASRIVQAVDAALTPDAVRRAAAVSTPIALRPALQRAVLLGLHVVRVLSLGELIAFIGAANCTPTCLPARTALLVLDSLSAYFYLGALPQGLTREQWRMRADACAHVLDGLASLRRLDREPSVRITVVATTQMAQRMLGDGRDGVLAPVGADSRPATAAAACEWGPSVLGKAWRILLFFYRVRHRVLYIQAAPPAVCAALEPEPVHRCIPIGMRSGCLQMIPYCLRSNESSSR